jgi:hypothetical protein
MVQKEANFYCGEKLDFCGGEEQIHISIDKQNKELNQFICRSSYRIFEKAMYQT